MMKILAKQGMTMIVVPMKIGFTRVVADRVIITDTVAIVEQGLPSFFLNFPDTIEQRFL